MKKTLLAAALAFGFAGVAQAETSVTLYGILDAGIGYERHKGTDVTGADFEAKRTGLINGVQYGNRWGLRGTEDLGNGLQAVFQVESGFNLGTGRSAQGGRLFGRHATLGLRSDAWGQLDFGRQTNIASKYLAGVVSPFGASFGQANAGAVFSSANTVRWDNMIMYQTPNFSGFQFGVGYAFEVDGSHDFDYDDRDDTNTRGITTGLRYANGPLAVALTYDQVRTAEAAGDDDIKVWGVGASYDFEVVKLHAGFGQARDGVLSTAFDNRGFSAPVNELSRFSSNTFYDGLRINSYSVGLSAPLGGGKIMASWMMADPTDVPLGWEDEKQHTYSLGYTYDLSKRTSMYAIGSYAKDSQFVDGNKSTLVGLGVVHKF